MNAPQSLAAEPVTLPVTLPSSAPDGIGDYLAPFADGDGVGVSLRHDPVFQKIREARHQDDASLPMREWERPLIKADWKAVAALAGDALRTRSKDFQLAAWLCEAWTHQRGVEGFTEGMRLLHEMAARFWDHAYPQLEDGDSDARVAPFVWLNQTFAMVLKLQIPLLTLSVEPGWVNFDDWSRVAGRGFSDENAGELTREFLDGEVGKGTNLADLVRLEEQLGAALDMTATLERGLDTRLGNDAPSFSRVMEALMDLQRAARSLRGDRAAPAVSVSAADAAPIQVPAALAESVVRSVADHDRDAVAAVIAQPLHAVSDAPAVMTPFRIQDRTHAYELLDAVAQFLARTEPHSPTPYLLKRAVAWGGMPLPELMREVVSQEGDLTRYFAMLGLHE
jgi:type VI secretion system protein ImpA